MVLATLATFTPPLFPQPLSSVSSVPVVLSSVHLLISLQSIMFLLFCQSRKPPLPPPPPFRLLIHSSSMPHYRSVNIWGCLKCSSFVVVNFSILTCHLIPGMLIEKWEALPPYLPNHAPPNLNISNVHLLIGEGKQGSKVSYNMCTCILTVYEFLRGFPVLVGQTCVSSMSAPAVWQLSHATTLDIMYVWFRYTSMMNQQINSRTY